LRLDPAAKPDVFKRDPAHLPTVALPDPERDAGPGLWATVAARRSVRHYRHEPLELSELSQILWASGGITHSSPGLSFRAAPSAGALYPIETYVVANRISGVEAGVHHYDPAGHRLLLVRSGGCGRELAVAALGQEICESAGAVLAWTALAERTEWKYGDRAHRYVYMDAGHVGGNFYLAAEALGLGACGIGAFYDDEVNGILGVDGARETVVYMGAVGRKR
jgi:SagB-type dehydrogenase family enzyme